MIVISDTSPIIYFAKIEKLYILKELYSIIYIPKAVWEEIILPISKSNENIPEDIKYELKAKEEGWLIIRDPTSEYKNLALKLSENLGRGEAHAIALSLEIKADLLLINDKEAKIIAESKGIKTKWNAEILLDAFKKKIIKNFYEFKKNLDKMVENGLWIKKSLYEKILNLAKTINN